MCQTGRFGKRRNSPPSVNHDRQRATRWPPPLPFLYPACRDARQASLNPSSSRETKGSTSDGMTRPILQPPIPDQSERNGYSKSELNRLHSMNGRWEVYYWGGIRSVVTLVRMPPDDDQVLPAGTSPPLESGHPYPAASSPRLDELTLCIYRE